jgi:hypothetical protein
MQRAKDAFATGQRPPTTPLHSSGFTPALMQEVKVQMLSQGIGRQTALTTAQTLKFRL